MRRTAALLLLFGTAFFVNISSLKGGFVWDDYNLIVENHWIKSLENLRGVFTHDFFNRVGDDVSYGYYRPVVTASYVFNYLASGLSPFGYHLTNVLLHCLSTVLAALVLCKLGLSIETATAASLLFAVHPIHTENIAWISGRTDLVAFFFSILALYLHLSAFRMVPAPAVGKKRKRKAKRREPPKILRVRWPLLVFAALLFGIALLAKEMSVVLIPWLLIIHIVFRKDRFRLAARFTLPSIVVFLLYAAVRFFWLHVSVPMAVKGHTPARIILGIPSLLVRYLGWLLFPWKQNAYVVNPYLDSPFDYRFLGSVILLGVIVFFLIKRRNPPHLLFAAMLGTAFLPIANVIRIAAPLDMGNVMAERFCYFPSFPFVALLGLLATPLFRRRRLLAWTSVLLLTVTGGYATWTRNLDWHDELSFFQKTLDQNPNTLLLMVRLAGAEVRAGKLDAALETILTAKKVAPRNPGVLTVEAAYYVARRQFDKAIPIQEDLVSQIDFGRVRAENNLAFLYAATGKAGKAETIWKDLIAGGHGYAVIYYNVAEIARRRGDRDTALENYRRAFRERPHDRRYASALAGTLESTEDYAEAVKVYQETRRLYPDDPRLLNNLGAVYEEMGNLDEALTSYEEAIRRDPGYAMALLNAANVLRLQGRLPEAELRLRSVLTRFQDNPKVSAAAAARLRALRSQMDQGGTAP